MHSTVALENRSEAGLTCNLVFAIFSAVLGSFQFGWNTGVINAPQKVIESFMNETNINRTGYPMNSNTLTILWSSIVSVFAVGGMIGGLFNGAWADRFGRKRGLIINNIFGITAAALMGLSKLASSFEMLLIGRLIVGFNCGLFTGLTPMYLSEISPRRIRGALGTLNQLAVTVALLASQVIGIPQILGNEQGWPLLLGLTAAPAVLQLILMPFCPESPRYLLLTKEKEKEASEALVKLRGTEDIQNDLDEMRMEQQDAESETKVSIPQLLCSNSLRLPLVVSLVLQMSQQLSGINAVFYYSTSLFQNAGLLPTEASYATLGVGVIMVGMTIVTIPLMDRAGRRTLHLLGLVGMFIFSIIMTLGLSLTYLVSWFSYVSVASALLYVMSFAIGPGSIPWLIVAELFAQGARSSAVSMAVLVNWTCNLIVGLTFLPLQSSLGNLSFIPFTVLLGVFCVFLFIYMPETKNKTFEEIQEIFRSRHSMYQSAEQELTRGTSNGATPGVKENTQLITDKKKATNL